MRYDPIRKELGLRDANYDTAMCLELYLFCRAYAFCAIIPLTNHSDFRMLAAP